MSFLKNLFFSKPKDDDYETILSNLADDIQKRRVSLSEIRLRERRSTLLVTLYTFLAWVAYVSTWYFQVAPFFSSRQKTRPATRFAQSLPVVLGPILVLFIRRIVQIWYKRIGDAEEKGLREAEKNRRLKVEEIKKKTNYYSTRSLLEKYDAENSSPSPSAHGPTAPPNGTPMRSGGPRQSMAGFPPQTPQARGVPGHLTATPGSSISTRGQRPGPSAAFMQPPPQPIGPPKKQWYDRLADAVLGADPDEDSTNSKYALICEKCFKHNGLVKAEQWETTQYICPKCGHLNKAPKSKRDVSPISPTSPSDPSSRDDSLPPVEAGDKILSPTPAKEVPEGFRRRRVELGKEKDAETSMMDVDEGDE